MLDRFQKVGLREGARRKGQCIDQCRDRAGAAGVAPRRRASRNAHVGADDAALLELPGDDAGAAGGVEDEPVGGGRQHLGDEVEPRAMPGPLQAPALLQRSQLIVAGNRVFDRGRQGSGQFYSGARETLS